MPITQLHPGVVPGERYGPFDRTSGPHPVGLLTQLHPGAVPGRRYGSFAGRTSDHPVGKLTQLRPGVVPGRQYGSFARIPAPPPVPPGSFGAYRYSPASAYNVFIPGLDGFYREPVKKREKERQEDRDKGKKKKRPVRREKEYVYDRGERSAATELQKKHGQTYAQLRMIDQELAVMMAAAAGNLAGLIDPDLLE